MKEIQRNRANDAKATFSESLKRQICTSRVEPRGTQIGVLNGKKAGGLQKTPRKFSF